MNYTEKGLAIFAAAVVVIEALIIISSQSSQYVSKQGSIGVSTLMLSAFSFFIGLILCIVKKSRTIGLSIIVFSLIGALIGFSICSST